MSMIELAVRIPVRRRISDGCLVIDWRFFQDENKPRDLGQNIPGTEVIAYVNATVPVPDFPANVSAQTEVVTK